MSSFKTNYLRLLLIFLGLIMGFRSNAQNSLPKSFTDLLSRDDMMFEMPDSFIPTEVLHSRLAPYDYAITYPGKNFEVRYILRPADERWKEYKEAIRTGKKMDVNINPDSSFASAFETITLNVSGLLPEMKIFDTVSVKNEFNADWGATVAFEPRGEFARQYKYCLLVCIHKKKVGEAYIFFLANKTEGFNDLMNLAFHALRFNSF